MMCPCGNSAPTHQEFCCKDCELDYGVLDMDDEINEYPTQWQVNKYYVIFTGIALLIIGLIIGVWLGYTK